MSGADAIHPGYGLLSESPEFVDACKEAGIIFIGPTGDTMRRLGKVAARNLAIEIGVPVVPATEPLPDDMAEVARMADSIGYAFDRDRLNLSGVILKFKDKLA